MAKCREFNMHQVASKIVGHALLIGLGRLYLIGLEKNCRFYKILQGGIVTGFKTLYYTKKGDFSNFNKSMKTPF